MTSFEPVGQPSDGQAKYQLGARHDNPHDRGDHEKSEERPIEVLNRVPDREKPLADRFDRVEDGSRKIVWRGEAGGDEDRQ